MPFARCNPSPKNKFSSSPMAWMWPQRIKFSFLPSSRAASCSWTASKPAWSWRYSRVSSWTNLETTLSGLHPQWSSSSLFVMTPRCFGDQALSSLRGLVLCRLIIITLTLTLTLTLTHSHSHSCSLPILWRACGKQLSGTALGCFESGCRVVVHSLKR